MNSVNSVDRFWGEEVKIDALSSNFGNGPGPSCVVGSRDIRRPLCEIEFVGIKFTLEPFVLLHYYEILVGSS